MKNKKRKHLAGVDSKTGSMNCKGSLTHITRPIKSMSSTGFASDKYEKKKMDKKD